MPYLKIQTNLPLTEKAELTVLQNASQLVAQELEKSLDLTVVALEWDTPMYFAGSDDPVAYLELKSVGLLGAKTKSLGKGLCALLETHLGIPRTRVYAKFIDGHAMWGWRGDTL
jgi:hypothetical protein